MDRKSNVFYMKYNLQLFAQEGTGGEKTEDATTKKISDARKEGQVAKSMDLVTAGLLLVLFLTLKYFVGFFGNEFIKVYKGSYSIMDSVAVNEFTVNAAHSLFVYGLKKILLISAPVFTAAVVVAFTLNLAQVKWKPTTKTLEPKLGKINPISGFKKMLSKDKLFDLLKSISKILIIMYIVYDTLKDQWNLILEMYSFPLNQAVSLIGNISINLGIKISMIFIFISVIDYIYQFFKFKKDMKMSKQEVKDEYKQSEGDPQVKGKIRSKMREVSQKRMMQSLPEADVVITNPTHLAVAIKYDKEAAGAPVVIAKGADYIAQKIKEVAKENKIEIVENKPLARMLYYNVDIDSEIPQELYQTVAEVLAYVYGLKGKL